AHRRGHPPAVAARRRGGRGVDLLRGGNPPPRGGVDAAGEADPAPRGTPPRGAPPPPGARPPGPRAGGAPPRLGVAPAVDAGSADEEGSHGGQDQVAMETTKRAAHGRDSTP